MKKKWLFLSILGALGLAGCAERKIRRKGVAASEEEEVISEPSPAVDILESVPHQEEVPREQEPDPMVPRAPVYFYYVKGNDPGGRLERALDTACKRWANATGVRIEVGRGSEIGLASGSETEHSVQWAKRDEPPLNGASGRALFDNWMRTKVYITDTMQDASEVGLVNLLTHELGHSLGRRGGHTEEGITAESFSSFELTPIDSEALVYVCERLLCPVMNPEG